MLMENSLNTNYTPRILVISNSSFNGVTGTGITLSNLFSIWPSQKLAIVYEDSYPNDINLCYNEYKLSKNEILYKFPISCIQKKNIYKIKNNITNISNINRNTHSDNFIIRSFIIKIFGGIEILKKKILSDSLKIWIKKYNPELIYCHFSSLYDIYFINQILLIFSVPLVIHIMDDFSFQYNKGLFAQILKIKWSKELLKILQKASCRICIGEDMAYLYQERYHLQFIDFFNSVDVEKWIDYPVNKQNYNFTIVYSGTINNKNINNLRLLSEVVNEISNNKCKILFNIYSFQGRINSFKKYFIKYNNVFLDIVPEGDLIIPILKNADLLFLPIDFSKSSIERMQYSMFTKIPAYMASGTPILLFGPEEISSVKYALKDKWAYTVTENNQSILMGAVIKMMSDDNLRKSISERALFLVRKNHDIKIVGNNFKATLINAVTK